MATRINPETGNIEHGIRISSPIGSSFHPYRHKPIPDISRLASMDFEILGYHPSFLMSQDLTRAIMTASTKPNYRDREQTIIPYQGEFSDEVVDSVANWACTLRERNGKRRFIVTEEQGLRREIIDDLTNAFYLDFSTDNSPLFKQLYHELFNYAEAFSKPRQERELNLNFLVAYPYQENRGWGIFQTDSRGNILLLYVSSDFSGKANESYDEPPKKVA